MEEKEIKEYFSSKGQWTREAGQKQTFQVKSLKKVSDKGRE
jgi:hypothetical protein